MDVVGVVDSPGTELVGIVAPPPSTGDLVGVMAKPRARARRPVQLTLADGPVDTGAIEVAPASEPSIDEIAPPEPLVLELAEAGPMQEAWDDELAHVEPGPEPRLEAFVEREPAPLNEAVATEPDMEREPFEAVVAAPEAFEDTVIVADPTVVIELPGTSTLAADVPALEMAVVETAEVEAVPVETPAPDHPAVPGPAAVAKPRPPRATKPPATRSKAGTPPRGLAAPGRPRRSSDRGRPPAAAPSGRSRPSATGAPPPRPPLRPLPPRDDRRRAGPSRPRRRPRPSWSPRCAPTAPCCCSRRRRRAGAARAVATRSS
jgi:hypothetical protein